MDNKITPKLIDVLNRAIAREAVHNSPVLYTEITAKRIVYDNYPPQDRELIEDAPLLQILAITQAARIAALEAEVEALKNPPYRIVIEKDPSQRARDFPYHAVVMCGDHELPFDGDQWNTESEARAEAQQFIDKLPAPFGAKGK